MPNNIESFVKTLESEGVDAGRKAAQKIEAEAKEKANKIISEAKEKADQIIEQSEAEAEKVQARMNSSLELAMRDAIFQLREKLSRQLDLILKLNVEKALKDEETLVNVLREVIPAYAKAGAGEKRQTEVKLPKDLKSKLLDSTLKELSNSLKKQDVQLDVSSNLAKSGFEYKIEGSTIEVTTDSVTSLLSEMIDPDLQQFLAKAAESDESATTSES